MSFRTWLERPRWAVVVYVDSERVCVLETFIFRASAESYADTLNNAGHAVYPRTTHRVEPIKDRLRPGERCVQQ